MHVFEEGYSFRQTGISQGNLLSLSFRQMLRALLRYCIENSIQVGDLVDTLKWEFVHAAEEHLGELGKRPSNRRISLITGIHDKQVTRLRSGQGAGKRQVSVTHQVIQRWKQSHELQTPEGSPKALSAEGSQSEFHQLARSVNAHMNPYTILFELERQGLVQKTADGVVLLKA